MNATSFRSFLRNERETNVIMMYCVHKYLHNILQCHPLKWEIVQLEPSDSLMEPMIMKAEWRSASTMPGEQSVTTVSVPQTPELSVDIWGTLSLILTRSQFPSYPPGQDPYFWMS